MPTSALTQFYFTIDDRNRKLFNVQFKCSQWKATGWIVSYLPIVLMNSRSSMSYRGESSWDPSSSDVVSPDMLYVLLLSTAFRESCWFIFLRTRGHVERKEVRFSDPLGTFLDRASTGRSHICSFYPFHNFQRSFLTWWPLTELCN